MTNDIVIGGISIATLRAQQAAIRKDAVTFVAQAISSGREAFDRLKEASSVSEAEALANEAAEHFENAQLVAGVANITFSLPYYEEYGPYESEDIISHALDNIENENVTALGSYWRSENALGRLYNVVSDMESSARDWNSSRC
jgi:hypothetical protein